MIITITPNPSLDRTLEVTRFGRGGVMRTAGHRVEAGGKGINVARALHAHGVTVRAILPVGGFEGAQMTALLRGADLDAIAINIGAAIRVNVSIVEPDGTTTKINEPGPPLTADEVEDLLAAAAREAAAAEWVVGSGSLPPGAPPTFFADMTARVRETSARVAVDTSGAALSAAITARPDLVKPNLDELAAVARREIVTLGDAIDAARTVCTAGTGAVLASLGPDGAVLVTPHDALHGWCPVLAPRSTVGAGDASLAGYLAAGTEDASKALAHAVAFGAAAVALPGTQMPHPDDVSFDDVEVTQRPELNRTLNRSVGQRAGLYQAPNGKEQ